MRLDINLATQPYEDVRQFWLRWGTALAAAGILTLFLLAATFTGWFSARRDRVRQPHPGHRRRMIGQEVDSTPRPGAPAAAGVDTRTG